jgi:hypothetical protein
VFINDVLLHLGARKAVEVISLVCDTRFQHVGEVGSQRDPISNLQLEGRVLSCKTVSRCDSWCAG